jgi:hypothetical protein
LRLSELQNEHRKECANNPAFSLNWSIVKDWNEDSRFIVSAAFWLFLADSNTWRLFIVSPEVRHEGVRRSYRNVQKALLGLPHLEPLVALKDISVIDSNDRLVALLQKAVRTTDGISHIRFSRNVINGELIEDAFIYRMT